MRKALHVADWVSLKIDALSQDLWKRIDHPHPSLDHDDILAGMEEFASFYKGTLCSETMLVKGLNDGPAELEKVARFLSTSLNPSKAYISVPTRPPAVSWVQMPDAETVAIAYAIFAEQGIDTETLTGYEGNAFVVTDDPIEEILNILPSTPCAAMLSKMFCVARAQTKKASTASSAKARSGGFDMGIGSIMSAL